MKIQSIWKIEWVVGAVATTFLDYGDLMDTEPSFGSEQEALTQAAVSAIWSRSYGLGAAQRAITWNRQRTHASPAAAREFCVDHGAALPFLQDGFLRVTIQGGGARKIDNAVIISAYVEPIHGIPHATLTRYVARGGITTTL